MGTIADCTCYHDCRSCSQSGDFHQHSDEPCPEHPDPVDETGDAPLGLQLTAWVNAERGRAIDRSFRAEQAS